MAWHFLRSSMQIAILFIYNHCQLLNNIYLRSNFISSTPCHSSQIFHDKRQQKSAPEQKVTQGRAREYLHKKYLSLLLEHVSVLKIEILVLMLGKDAGVKMKTFLYRSFFSLRYRSEALASSFEPIYLYTWTEKKLANIRDDYVHCVTDE